MQKYMSALLVLMMFILVFPIGVHAAESTDTNQSELVSLACEVFPEYKNKLLNPSISTNSCSIQQRELLINEQRAVSDTESLLYTEYSDGTILLTSHSGTYTRTVNSIDSSSQAVIYDITIKAEIVGYDGYFKLSNVNYSLINSQNDQITATGTPQQ